MNDVFTIFSVIHWIRSIPDLHYPNQYPLTRTGNLCKIYFVHLNAKNLIQLWRTIMNFQ